MKRCLSKNQLLPHGQAKWFIYGGNFMIPFKPCQIIGDNQVSLSSFIDNVLAHHFNTYGNEITRLYNEKHKGINILKNTDK